MAAVPLERLVPPPRYCLVLVCPDWLALIICAEMRCNLLGSFPCSDSERALDVTGKWLPKALQGETQLIQVTQNPGVPEVGRSLRAHPVTHLPLAQAVQKNECPNLSCRPGGSSGAGDLIHLRMDSVEVTCNEVTPLWEQRSSSFGFLQRCVVDGEGQSSSSLSQVPGSCCDFEEAPGVSSPPCPCLHIPCARPACEA